MSAPRKIWVDWPHNAYEFTPDGAGETYPDTATAYHHDDVVRELVEAAQWLLQNVSGKTLRNAGYVLSDTSDLDEFLTLRAALAKIAQEG